MKISILLLVLCSILLVKSEVRYWAIAALKRFSTVGKSYFVSFERFNQFEVKQPRQILATVNYNVRNGYK